MLISPFGQWEISDTLKKQNQFLKEIFKYIDC